VATAVPDDVDLEGGGVIATDLTDAQIQSYIDDAAFEAGEAINDYADWEMERKRQLEKYYAALKIRTLADKAISSTSRETASVSYEGGGMSIHELRNQVDKRDPTGTLARNTNTRRYVGSTHES
jgi:hypothetical protein